MYIHINLFTCSDFVSLLAKAKSNLHGPLGVNIAVELLQVLHTSLLVTLVSIARGQHSIHESLTLSVLQTLGKRSLACLHLGYWRFFVTGRQAW